MTNSKFRIAFIVSICISSTGLSQTSKAIDSLENQYQNCLDKGQYMADCSKAFYLKMDSMLNVVYIRLRSSFNPTQQAKLKVEQRSWLIERNKFFQKTLKELKAKNGSSSVAQDDVMLMYDDNAEFVEKRVLELIKRLNK